MLYAGFDVHRDATVVCILTSTGRVRRRVAVPSTKRGLQTALAGVRGRIMVACESGPMAAWVKSVLQTRLRQVTVCDRRRTRLTATENKNDHFDAENLANLLRLGRLHAVYVPGPREGSLRRLAYHHLRMVQERLRVMARLRALFLEHGIRLTMPRSAPHRVPLRCLRDAASRYVGQAYLTQLITATSLVADAREQLVQHARVSPAFELLQTIPYIGEIRAAEIIAVIGDITRFPSVRAFWAYAGLGVVQRVSSEHRVENGRVVRSNRSRGIRIARGGQPLLKRVIRDVALYSSLGSGEFRKIFDRHVARGKSKAIARLSLARKVAAVVLAIWRSGLQYDVSLLRRKKTGTRGSGRASAW